MKESTVLQKGLIQQIISLAKKGEQRSDRKRAGYIIALLLLVSQQVFAQSLDISQDAFGDDSSIVQVNGFLPDLLIHVPLCNFSGPDTDESCRNYIERGLETIRRARTECAEQEGEDYVDDITPDTFTEGDCQKYYSGCSWLTHNIVGRLPGSIEDGIYDSFWLQDEDNRIQEESGGQRSLFQCIPGARYGYCDLQEDLNSGLEFNDILGELCPNFVLDPAIFDSSAYPQPFCTQCVSK